MSRASSTPIALKWLTSSLLCLAIGSAQAQQVLKMRDGETLSARISQKEVSRVAIDGARVRSVVGARGDYDIQVDQDIGQLFLRPTSGADLPRPINLFLTDDAGRTFALVLTPEDVPAESVVISSKKPQPREERGLGDAPYLSAIKELVRHMAVNDDEAFGYEIVDHLREIPIWNEVRLILERAWVGDELIGERYTLTNTTVEEVRLAEQEFLRRGVLAIAIDNAILGPRQSTGLYVVREAADGHR